VRGYLAAKDSISLMRIEAHAEDQATSEQRALAVGRWLVAHGVDCKRLLAVGFGPNKPIADSSTPEGRAANSRIEFHNAQLRGRAIGGMPADGGGLVAGDLCP
jgi:OOP family OmpA-OmpF porin